MKRRTRAALLACSLLAVAAPVTLMQPASVSADATSTVAFYSMDEGPASTVLVDSSGHQLNGTIGTDVTTAIGFAGATLHRFKDVDPTLPPANIEHLDRVPHDPLLNPDAGDFAVTVRYRTTKSFGNVIQKGQNLTVGGYFKFEAPTGHMTCLFKGSLGEQRSVISPQALNDGQWHTVRCERRLTGVDMYVDGALVGSIAGTTGTISNNKQMSIGGKTVCDQIVVTCDYFVGDIDYVRIEKGSDGPANVAPTAVATANCTGLICTFSAAASGDTDGAIQTYEWTFGDGATEPATSEAVNTSHAYATAGTYPVGLTVVDDRGATAVVTIEVTVAPRPEVISFVDQATATINAKRQVITIPTTVHAGDGLVLFFSENTHSTTTDPPGWTLLDAIDGGYATTKVWRKVATASDPGATVQLDLALQSKGVLTLLAYRGTSWMDPVSASAKKTDIAVSAQRVTPIAAAGVDQSWALSYWMHGDSTTSALTAPAGVTTRSTATQTGSGRVTTLVADSSASVPLGPFGGLSATAPSASYTTATFTLILSPATAPPPNEPPTAVITDACTGLHCDFSSAGSADSDGAISAVAWDFGDGTTGTEADTTHEYAADGTYTVTLTVTDDDGAGTSTTVVVDVTAFVPPPPVDVITFVDQAMGNANATSITALIPATVQPGDGLVMFLSENTLATISDPVGVPGWTVLDTVSAGTTTTRVWRKVAATGDAGTTVRINLSAISKANLIIAAYRGTALGDPVASFARATSTSLTAARATPVTGAVAPSWAISYWMHRDSTSTALVAPTGVVVRGGGTQTLAGRVTTLLADSAAMVTTSTYGGLTATAAAAGTAATMWTIVLAPLP